MTVYVMVRWGRSDEDDDSVRGVCANESQAIRFIEAGLADVALPFGVVESDEVAEELIRFSVAQNSKAR